MSGAMMRFVEVVKHYPGQQQVNLSVEIEVPGSWFGGTEMGSLNASERRQKYKAQAVEYAEVREFPGASLRARKVKGFGRRRRVRESMCLHTTCRAELSRAGLDLGIGSSGSARKRAAPERSQWCMAS